MGLHRRFALALAVAVSAPVLAAPALSHFPDPMFHDGLEGVAAGPFTDGDAARFLAQATFGSTSDDIAHLRSVGYSAWLDEQFAKTPSLSEPYLDWVLAGGQDYISDEARMEIWSANAAGTGDPSRTAFPNNARGDQLRQRVAFALSEIFVVSNSNGTLAYEPWCLASFNDLLVNDAFANYRTLLEDVTKHPAMGIFLSSIQNMKADPVANTHPDQNYAREIMQLFSVGLVQFNVDGTPVLSAGGEPVPDVHRRRRSKVSPPCSPAGTGTIRRCQDSYFNCGPRDYNDPIWQLPMKPVEEYHDDTSDKQLLNYSGVALGNGVLMHGGERANRVDAGARQHFPSSQCRAVHRDASDPAVGDEQSESGVRGTRRYRIQRRRQRAARARQSQGGRQGDPARSGSALRPMAESDSVRQTARAADQARASVARDESRPA